MPKRELPYVNDGSLTKTQIIRILEDLARNGGATAKTNAIRLLRDIRNDENSKPGAKPGGFDDLDELADKRQKRVA